MLDMRMELVDYLDISQPLDVMEDVIGEQLEYMATVEETLVTDKGEFLFTVIYAKDNSGGVYGYRAQDENYDQLYIFTCGIIH